MDLFLFFYEDIFFLLELLLGFFFKYRVNDVFK